MDGTCRTLSGWEVRVTLDPEAGICCARAQKGKFRSKRLAQPATRAAMEK